MLIGITSTLLALPVFSEECLPEEIAEWERLRAQHLEEVRAGFASLKPDDRLLLFCHDPTALPFLWREEQVRARLNQIERTIIGHLHSRLIFFKSQLLRGIPTINFLGHTPKRVSRALREARLWKPFKVFLCPSISGIQLLKDGGFCTVDLDPGHGKELRFKVHRLPWSGSQASGE